MEADFQQYYGLDLERLRDTASVRHVAVLAAQLPSSSRCFRAEVDELEWSPEMYLFAKIEYDLQTLIWQLASAFSKKKPPKPKPIDPPAKTKAYRRKLEKTNLEEIDALLGLGGE